MDNGDLVTIPLDKNNNSSNTYVVYGSNEEECFLYHPLNPNVLIKKPKAELNKVSANLKDSTERNLSFAHKNSSYLDYDTVAELESLILYYIVNRKLTPKQLSTMSQINGRIASIHFHNDLYASMRYIEENKAVLNPFNEMWYNNFKDLFSGKKPVTSPKQRASIFNIAGFVLAELEPIETPLDRSP